MFEQFEREAVTSPMSVWKKKLLMRQKSEKVGTEFNTIKLLGHNVCFAEIS